MTSNCRATKPVAAILLPVLLACVSAAREGSSEGAEMNLLKSIRLRSQRIVPLGKESMLILRTERDQERKVPVMLLEMQYDYQIVNVDKDGKMREKSASALCFELRSTGDIPHTWAMWSGVGLGHFRLLAGPDGGNLFAWVEGSNVFFTDVSKPKDRLVEFTRILSRQGPAGFERIPVAELVPEVRSWGVNALFFDIFIRTIKKDAAGNLTVKISGPASEDVFTLIRQDGTWHKK